MEVDIKISAELVESALNMRKHHLHALASENFLTLIRGKITHTRVLFHNSGGNVINVVTGVTIRWRR
ncbi:hypothetical protein NL337_26990, partial [Klebsiella pneumoniae]|nr:hypothetical protein [Klebsiella pneumoniae]